MDTNIEQQIPIIPVVIGFLILLVSTHFLRRKLHERYLRQEGQIKIEGGRMPSIEERVAANRTWASGEIRSKDRSFMAAIWFLAAVWNLTFGVSFTKQFSNPEIKTGGLIMLGFFALMGLPVIAFAIRVTMRHLRFGESLCRITGKAGVLGQKITGYISTKTEIEPEGDYTVMLQCIEIYSVRSGKKRVSKTEIRWQGKVSVARAGKSSLVGIPFSIDIPGYPPETGYQISRGQINWQLSVTALTKGVDYSATFVVPVFKMD